MARDSCLTRVVAGVAMGGTVGGAIGKFIHIILLPLFLSYLNYTEIEK